MFDPFGDFESAGYLRNIEGLKDAREVKIQEHLFFEANLEEALAFLASIRGRIGYRDFCAFTPSCFPTSTPGPARTGVRWAWAGSSAGVQACNSKCQSCASAP